MSWRDIFYPGNPGRQNKVVRLSTKLKHLMEHNFEATNHLIDMLNNNSDHYPPLTHVKVGHMATIKANSEKLIAKMNEVQGVVNEFDKKLASKLDPEIYKKLKLPDTSFKQRLVIAEKVFSVGLGITSSVAGIFVLSAISSGIILTKIVTAIGVLKSCAIASVVLGVLTMGVDMIASAIIGAVERDKLEDAIDQLEEAMEGFEPASKEYSKTILRVQVELEIILGGV